LAIPVVLDAIRELYRAVMRVDQTAKKASRAPLAPLPTEASTRDLMG
jgi:hypothetical protein